MQLKNNSSDQKLRGGYYTPEVLADFIVKNIEINKEINILEPSCGDGIFINSIKKIIPKEKIKSLTAIEIVEEEANKVKNRFKDEKFHILNEDFLNFYRNNRNKRFDLIIGNPPYIRYQYLSKEQRELQSEILKNNGIKPNKLINSWVCFLVACIELLDDKGTIGFVIPAELLQVAYAEELRKHLSNNLAEIILITFKELVFPDIEQEVIVLIGKKDKSIPVNGAKIAVVEFNNFDDMQNKETFDNIEYQLIEHTEEKWTKYFLESNENELIRKIRKDDRFQTFNDIAIINYTRSLIDETLVPDLSELTFVDISNKESNKGNALLKLCKYLNISPNDVIAIGDERNDIPMFKVAGHNVIVENAFDEIKEYAHEIIGSNNNSGVAKYLEKHFIKN